MNSQSNLRLTRRHPPFTTAASLVAMGIGTLVLLGWTFDIPALKSLLPGWVTMKANTALVFIFLGVSLWILRNEDAALQQRRFAQVLAGIVLALGLLTMGEYIFGWDLGIDQFLFKDLDTPALSHPGRMSSISAFLFCTIGLGVLLIESGSAQYLFIASLYLSFFALIGYLFGAESLYRLAGFTSIALHTVILFFILSIGFLLARPNRSVVGTFLSPLPGAAVSRVMLGGTAIAIALLDWLLERGVVSGFLDVTNEAVLDVALFSFLASVMIYVSARILIRAEEKLRQWETIFQYAGWGVVVANPADNTITAVNPALARMYGYTEAEMIGKPLAELYAPAERARIPEYARRAHETGFVSFESLHQRKDGTAFPVLEEVTAYKDMDGKVLYRAANVRDLSERKQAEEALRASEERFRTAFNSSPLSLGISNMKEGRFLDVNEAFLKFSGYERHEVIGHTSAELNMYSNPQDRAQLVQQLSELGRVSNLEMELRIKSGETRQVRGWVEQIELGGAPVILGILQDITEQKHAEENLRILSSAVQQSGDIILITDTDGNIEYANPSFEKTTGYAFQEVLGKKPNFLRSGRHSRDFYQQLWDTILKGGLFHAEFVNRKKNGELYYELKTITPIRNEQGGIVHLVSIGKDITEQKRRERERETLLALATALRAASNRAEMIPIILDEIVSLMELDGAAFALLEPASGEAAIELARGGLESWNNQRIPPGQGITGMVMASGETYVSNDVDSEPNHYRPDMVGELVSVACAPLVANEQTIGALWIKSKSHMQAGEVRLLEGIASMAATAVQRAMLYDQTERRLRRIQALHAIDVTISGSLDLRVTLDVVIGQVIEHLAVDAVDVLSFNPAILDLKFIAGRGFRAGAKASSSRPLDLKEASRALLDRRAILIPDLDHPEADFLRSPRFNNEGFSGYYGLPLIAKGQLVGILELFQRSPLRPTAEWLEFAATIAGQTAIAIDNLGLFDKLQRSNTDLIQAYDNTIEGWSRALDLRDKETEGHTQRVTALTLELARAAGIPEADLIHIRRGALLHDIGKMGVSDGILLKPDKLTDEEWAIMRQHPVFAYKLLLPIEFLRPALDIPYCHHEKWDGAGYPSGLKGEQIPLAARVFAVVDVYDALRSDRPYRKGWSKEKTLEHIRLQSGIHFDPRVVKAFLNLMEGK